MPKSKSYTYDVLIAHARADGAWVRDVLLPKLQAMDLRVFAEARDMPFGQSRADVLADLVPASENVLVVLTPDYVGHDPIPAADGGLSPDILRELRQVLPRCAPLDDNRALLALFNDARLSPWAGKCPQTINADARLDALLDALHDPVAGDGTPVLALFVRVLAERKPKADRCYTDLTNVMHAIERDNAPRGAGEGVAALGRRRAPPRDSPDQNAVPAATGAGGFARHRPYIAWPTTRRENGWRGWRRGEACLAGTFHTDSYEFQDAWSRTVLRGMPRPYYPS